MGNFRSRIRPRVIYARFLTRYHHSRRYAGRFKITAHLRRPHTLCARRSPPSAQGASEVFFLQRKKQKTECPRALRPRVKPLPYLIRRRLNAGRSNVKKQYKRSRFSPTPKKGCGEKRRGFSPRGAKRPRGRFPTGNRAGRGMAGISHAAKPCIKSPNRGSNSPFTVRTGGT